MLSLTVALIQYIEVVAVFWPTM